MCRAGWRWGASQHCLRRRHGGCYVRYPPFFQHSLVCACIFLTVPVFKFDPLDRPHFFLSGIKLLKRASALREEAQWLESEGLRKIELAVAGSEAEDFYGLLRGAISHTPISSVPPPPKNAILPQLLLSPCCLLRSPKRWHLKSLILQLVRQNWHQKPALQLGHMLWRWPSQPT